MAATRAEKQGQTGDAAALRPLVVCTDGPMVNQWYFEDEWNARVEASRYMVARGQRRAPCLDYVPGEGRIQHPSLAADGTRLEYRPKEEAR